MSTRVTWFSTGPFTTCEVLPDGEEMPDGQRVTADCALVIAGDDVAVLEGTYADVEAALRNALATLTTLRATPVPAPVQLPTEAERRQPMGRGLPGTILDFPL